MAFIFVLLIFIASSSHGILLRTSSHWGEQARNFCLQLLPPLSQERNSLGSLLCGEKVTDPELKEGLRQSSLLHLFVVSGSHLILLDQALQTLRSPLLIRVLILGVFAFLSGLEPPVVRAGLGLAIQAQLRSLAPDQRVALAGLACLSLFPTWVFGLSLPLSWLAALALAWPRERSLSEDSSVSQLVGDCFRVWFFLLPLLAGWGNTSPLGIVFNITLAPLISFLLLPLAVLALPGSVFAWPFEIAMQALRWLLQAFAPAPLPDSTLGSVSPQGVWLWVLFLQISAHLLRINMKRQKPVFRSP